MRGLVLFLLAVLSSVPICHGKQTSLPDFVGRRYFHGTPYEEARSYGPQALPELERMLNDPAMKPRWRSIVVIIAYIGAPESFRILRSFLWDRFRGPVDDATWKALLTVPNVMGSVPDAPGAPVVEYLVRGTNPEFWDSLPWSQRVHKRNGDQSIVMSEVSINGLACTGTKRAAEVLTSLKRRPYSPRQLANIEEGLRVNREVARDGLGAYLKRMREELGASADPAARKSRRR